MRLLLLPDAADAADCYCCCCCCAFLRWCCRSSCSAVVRSGSGCSGSRRLEQSAGAGVQPASSTWCQAMADLCAAWHYLMERQLEHWQPAKAGEMECMELGGVDAAEAADPRPAAAAANSSHASFACSLSSTPRQQWMIAADGSRGQQSACCQSAASSAGGGSRRARSAVALLQ